jgi:hypothetical protein
VKTTDELKQLDQEHKIITRVYLEKPVVANLITMLAAVVNSMFFDTVSAQFILIVWGISYLIFLALDYYVLSQIKKNPDFKKDPFFYVGFTSSNGLLSMVTIFTLLQLIPHKEVKDPYLTQFFLYGTIVAITQMYFNSKYFLAVHIKRIHTLEKKGILTYESAYQLAQQALDAHMKFHHGLTRPEK